MLNAGSIVEMDKLELVVANGGNVQAVVPLALTMSMEFADCFRHSGVAEGVLQTGSSF